MWCVCNWILTMCCHDHDLGNRSAVKFGGLNFFSTNLTKEVTSLSSFVSPVLLRGFSFFILSKPTCLFKPSNYLFTEMCGHSGAIPAFV